MDYAPLPLRLETERLILTPETEQDASWFCSLLNARGGHQFTVEEARDRIATMAQTMATTGIGALAMRTKPDGRPIGYCAIVMGRGSVAEPELAYEVLPHAQGNGYATEGAKVLLDAAFDTGRSRIWSTIRPWNAASLRVVEKLGFEQQHVTHDAHGDVLWLLRERQ